MPDIDPGAPLQIAVVAKLLADTGVRAIAANTSDGTAVFAPSDNFADVYPRITIEPPQVLPHDGGCGERSECFVTLHTWDKGDDATLVAGRLAGAARGALSGSLTISGHVVTGGRLYFQGTRSVGDPARDVTHLVSVYRCLTRPDL